MRFCTVFVADPLCEPGAVPTEVGAVMAPGGGVLTLPRLARLAGQELPATLEAVISAGPAGVKAALATVHAEDLNAAALHPRAVRFRPPLRHPGKIWGIGLNYRDHAADLDEQVPEEPASFMKPATAIIGPGDTIQLPPESRRVTAEAEVAVIIGRTARHISEAEAPAHIFGLTTAIDVTAEDILRRNPRYLTRAKSFDTFFSFGPWVVTLDEVPDPGSLQVRTLVNGQVRAENAVDHMTFSPYWLVAFHSRVMTLQPGDIISTGTPGAAVIEAGDRAGAQVDLLGELANPVARPRG